MASSFMYFDVLGVEALCLSWPNCAAISVPFFSGSNYVPQSCRNFHFARKLFKYWDMLLKSNALRACVFSSIDATYSSATKVLLFWTLKCSPIWIFDHYLLYSFITKVTENMMTWKYFDKPITWFHNIYPKCISRRYRTKKWFYIIQPYLLSLIN